MENTIQSLLQKNRITIRGIMVGFIILLLMIPVLNVSSLVQERSMRQQEVSREISSKWAGRQTINGPVLVLPYLELSPQKMMERKLAYFLPDELHVNAEVKPQIRRRSIYEIVVYQSEIKMTGTFGKPDIQHLNLTDDHILWDEAFINLGLTDFRGIEDQIVMTWDGDRKDSVAQRLTFEVGAAGNDFISNGLKVSMPYKQLQHETHAFDLTMRLRGSENLSFLPSGKTTLVNMTSSWPHPSFTGSFLPSDQARISATGFNAHWKILDLNRNFPQAFKDTKYDLNNTAFGVNFLRGSDLYSKTSRSIKYAFLFIALTLALYFFIDIFQKKQVHAFQYVLIGLALCIFYTLLLSISEYINFDLAYLIASTAIILMVTAYTLSVFGSRRIAALFSGVMILLYGFIYVMIQLQDWALLLGSIFLFVVLGLVMYYSKKINWKDQEGLEQE